MLPKKEVIKLERERKHLEQNLCGIKDMPGLPDAIFVIDSNKEEIAVLEANKLEIPVIAVVDTNCDPDPVSHVIPGNDDALRAIRLFASKIADAVIEGRQMAAESSLEEERQQSEEASANAGDAGPRFGNRARLRSVTISSREKGLRPSRRTNRASTYRSPPTIRQRAGCSGPGAAGS